MLYSLTGFARLRDVRVSIVGRTQGPWREEEEEEEKGTLQELCPAELATNHPLRWDYSPLAFDKFQSSIPARLPLCISVRLGDALQRR